MSHLRQRADEHPMNRLPVEYLAEMTKRRARGQLSVIAEETLYASLDRHRQPRDVRTGPIDVLSIRADRTSPLARWEVDHPGENG